MINPSFEKWKAYCDNYARVPVAVTSPWPDGLDPFALWTSIASDHPYAVLLESGRAGRYSYLAIRPAAVIRGTGQDTVVITLPDGRESKETGADPLQVLRYYMQSRRSPRIEGMPDFSGGAVGYISYDMNRVFEPTLPDLAADPLGLPHLYVMLVDELLVFDHEKREMIGIEQIPTSHATEETYRETVNKWMERLRHWSGHRTMEEGVDWEAVRKMPLAGTAPVHVSFGQEEFEEAVQKVQAYIAQGDVFQVNLSVRQSKPVHTPAREIYRTLRRLNPSPYMGYVHFPEFQLVSGSPELLVKVKGEEVSTRPIAGTRPRGKNDAEDEALARELIDNEKERAEHVMLVDLERNDLGRVCRYGSVEVSEFMVVEKYSHVMHIVSHVKGVLAEGKDAFDAVAATFPGGTITGAPKVRTMEIIEELEPVERGVYTGSIGWFGYDGDMELNIAIRTMVVKDGMAHVQAGAGIVIDSVPSAEYKESLKKAEALWKACEWSESRWKNREESQS